MKQRANPGKVMSPGVKSANAGRKTMFSESEYGAEDALTVVPTWPRVSGRGE